MTKKDLRFVSLIQMVIHGTILVGNLEKPTEDKLDNAINIFLKHFPEYNDVNIPLIKKEIIRRHG